MKDETATGDGWHELLLALAGRVSDIDLAAAAVLSDADDRIDLTVRVVSDVGAHIDKNDVLDLLTVARSGGSRAVDRAINARGDLPMPEYLFTPIGADAPLTDDLPSPLSAIADPVDLSAETGAQDPASTAVVDELSAGSGVVGIWAGLRWFWSSVENEAGKPSVQADIVYLVEVEDRRLLAEVATMGRGTAGSAVQLHVFASGDELPDHQRSLLASSALLWTHPQSRRPEVIAVFDEVHPVHGPGFTADHPMLSTEERDRVATYLSSAEPVLVTTARMSDVLAPERGEVVPLTFRTDGSFVWSEAVAYYTREHGLAPVPDLLETIRSANYHPDQPNAVELFRAELGLLRKPT